jgi:hypothetical protein
MKNLPVTKDEMFYREVFFIGERAKFGEILSRLTDRYDYQDGRQLV